MRGGRQRAARGRDLETEVSLNFDQAVNGAQVPLAVPTSQPCPTCQRLCPGTRLDLLATEESASYYRHLGFRPRDDHPHRR